MKVRFIPAQECPDSMKELQKLKQDPDMFCCMISNPDDQTDALVNSLIEEYGSKSESYYKSRGIYRPREQGTGSGDTTITAYIMPYLQNISNGHAVGIFYHKSIKSFIEPKISALFSSAPEHQPAAALQR